MFFQELETERLCLKNISMDDEAFIYAHFSHGDVTQYLLDAEPLTDMQGAREIIQNFTQPEPRSHHRWILVRKEDGKKIGTCGFHCWDRSAQSCDVGYDLSPEFEGKGYMSEALRAILAFARDVMDIRRVNACIYPENTKSVKIAERFGFVFCGLMKDEIFRGTKYPHKIFVLQYGTK